MNKRLIVFLVTVVFATKAQFALARVENWRGVYEYEGYFGRTAGSSPIVMHYKISITGNNKAPAILTIQGFQTDETLICNVVSEDNNKLTLLFRSYGDGKVNRYGVQVYKPGEPLLTLERRQQNGKTTIITYWLALTDPTGKQPKPGRYFHKVY